MIEKILLLGATGSIGTQCIELCETEKDRFHIVGVSFSKRVEVLENYIKYLPYLKYVGIEDKGIADQFSLSHPQYVVFSGEECNIRLVHEVEYDKVVNSLVGSAGFIPSLEVLKNNKTLCLANKESLVIGGELIKKVLVSGKGKMYPIDSEHVALSKLFKHASREEIQKVIITASGGSLRDYPLTKLKDVTLSDVLHHPTWSMGHRITIDSATMVNKGFEFIEASYLFDISIDMIDVLINDESLVHSALLFNDNSYLFEVGPSDMKVAISYALNETRRVKADYKEVLFNRKCSINFREFNIERYPLFKLVLDTFKLGGTSMAFLNAVDEEVVSQMIKGKLTYLEMEKAIEYLVKNKMINISFPSEKDIMDVDKKARIIARYYLLSK